MGCACPRPMAGPRVGTPRRASTPVPRARSPAFGSSRRPPRSRRSTGPRPTQAFTAFAVYSDGTEQPAFGPRFAIDTRATGELDVASGLFTANGVIGGASTITVSLDNPAGGTFDAAAMLSVRLSRTVRIGDVPADVDARFDALVGVEDPAREAGVSYPLDQVVMPQNVFPADVQWTRGAAGDLYRVTLEKPSARLVAYVAFDPSMHWTPETAGWRAVAQTEPDAPATLRVSRLEASSGELVLGTPVAMRFARAALTGSVYYWDIARGRIVRIDDGTAVPVEFMPNPPLDATGTSRCVGCHSVSNSGRYMAGRLGGGDNIGAVFDLTTDLTAASAPTVWPTTPSTQRWWFSSWSPDDTRMVVAFNDSDALSRQLRMVDPFTGAQLPVSGALPSGTHPAWSPDGTKIAYIANANSWGGDFTSGDIAILPVTGLDAVGPTSVIHAGSSLSGSVPSGSADSYPTWAPDASRIAFAHGTGTRSDRDRSALYAMGPDGSGVVRLDRASRGADGAYAFQPRFSPFQQGGFFWLSFLSRAPYGNVVTGTARPDRSVPVQQIWVTAIRVDAAPGEDPSSVPYWLPGQRTTSQNISAFWAPRACRPDGDACSVGSECCGGDCRPDAGGALVCSPPPPERCRNDGETCTTDADCCAGMGLSCIGNVCVAGPG